MFTQSAAPAAPEPASSPSAAKPGATREPNVVIRTFQPGDEAAFRALNEQWIRTHFTLEDKDREVLGNPQKYILQQGGHILMVVDGGETIGCCALIPMREAEYEVAKMTVLESYRGKGVGKALLAAVIGQARTLGARRLYLETNNSLGNAIHVYEALGFQHVPKNRVHPSPYARANVFMELMLS